MNISTRQSGKETVVTLAGRFTFSAHAAFRDVLVNHVEAMNSGGRVTFDLASVERCRVSAETSARKRPTAVSTTVRQTPSTATLSP